jgi:putative aldouronate transport system permease protein
LISVIITVLGTLLSLVLTTMLAYALSKKQLIGRRFLTGGILFTFLFNGGMIPTYLIVRSLGMLDSLAALIFPGAMGAYTFFIMRQSFAGVPASLEESARIDGAGEFLIYYRVYLPLVKPMLAAVGLLYVVRQWNLFFDGILYISTPEKWPLQVLVRQAIATASSLGTGEALSASQMVVSPEALQMASIILSALPMLMLYPFFQRSFIKGLTLGAIKE